MADDARLREVAVRLAEMAPEPPPFPNPVMQSRREGTTRRWVWALVGIVAVVFVVGVPLLLLRPAGPSPDVAGSGVALAEEMVAEWVSGALDGEFDDIARLTYGEFGEPEALDRLARTIHSYQERYGRPTVEIAPYEAGRTHPLRFTCVHLDFGEAALTGAIVTRSWPELGRRLWEFRSNMEGCPGSSAVTTTAPAG